MNTHDSHEKIFPADPRITAYAFSELEGDELKLIEAAVAADPALQAAVAELRGFGDTLTAVLGEEMPDVVSAPIIAPKVEAKRPRGRLIPFPLHYLATAAAACFAVVVWLRNEDAAPKRPAPLEEAPQVMELVAGDGKTDAPVGSSAMMLEMEGRTFSASLPEMKNQMVVFDSSLSAGVPVATNNKALESGVDAFAPLPAPVLAPVASLEARDAGQIVASQTRKREVSAAKASGVVATISVQVPPDYVYRRDSNMAAAGLVTGDFDQRRVDVSNEAYALPSDNAYRSVEAEPLSTFSIDVDTASYSNVRRFLNSGRLPPRDAVRIEELINYFPYRYAPPTGDVPFAAKLEVSSAPWAPEHRLVRIGLKGREVSMAERRPANLVFLIDVSGSMSSDNKLPLVKESLRLLVERLRPDDRVAIVTYAGSSGLALPSTPVSKKGEILASLDELRSGGSTNGAMGIHLAYDIAKANFVADGGINRVILCTDGDFNVGVTNRNELVRLIEEKAKSRVFLSIFGFGMGNYKDSTLEMLSGKGNGAYGYIDSRREAEKVFIEQVEGTLVTIAKDVKIQVEFNPAKVASYRLIGYENRMLAKEDFNNDAVDAGDIGAGHTVTALYEVVPAGVGGGATVDPLKYQKAQNGGRTTEDRGRMAESEEMLTVKIRYKAPEGDVSKKQEFPLVDRGAGFAQADGEFRFAAAVAAWGMLLRDSPHKGSATFEQVIAWAEDGLGDDAGGHRAEFVQLVRRSAEVK